MRIRGLAAALAGLALVGACGDRGAPSGPPEIAWGEQECGHCRMILSDRRFAAAARGPWGEAAYDDVGCLVAAGAAAPGEAWVADRESGEWVPVETAWFAVGTSEVTPMGSGTLAFAGRSRAEAVAAEGGRVARWSDLAGGEPPAGATDAVR